MNFMDVMPETARFDSPPVIAARGLSKYYEIYKKPSDRLRQMVFRGRRTFYEPFWALRDVSFSVSRGECLGIIGRNGAGKSTLLQILAGTLTPSSGNVAVNGRVAALLELGSGFNPEYTGRENIWLNASILGLANAEIADRFDAIIAFADIGQFIDQPVKSYSSGMALRLAFSVVAHVDADLLIIDEALAVGDAFFTQKCMRFMRKFISEKSVILVSHDTLAVSSLCTRAILLENGSIKEQGAPKDIVATYLKDMYEERQGVTEVKPTVEMPSMVRALPDEDFRDMRIDLYNSSTLRNDIQVFPFDRNSAGFGKGGASITNAYLLDKHGFPLAWIVGGEPVTLEIFARVDRDMHSPIIGFNIWNSYGQALFGDNTFIPYMQNPLFVASGQTIRAKFSFVMPILASGDYSISIAIAEGTQEDHVQHDWKHDAIIFRSTSTSCHIGMMGIPMKSITMQVEQ